MTEITFNGVTYDLDDLNADDNRGYADLITPAASSSQFPRYIAIMVDAIADSGRLLVSSSTTSVTLGTGSKGPFTLDTAVPYAVGSWVIMASAATPTTKYMIGQVTATSGTSLTVNVPDANHFTGSGAVNDWQIAATGEKGEVGATGAGDVNGPVSSTDNALTRWDGTGGDTTQDSGVIIDDSDNVTGINDLTVGNDLTVTGDISGHRGINTISGTSETLSSSNLGKYNRTTNSSTVTITVPPNASVSIAVNTEVEFFQAGTGQLVFAEGAGVTINSAEGWLSSIGQYRAFVLKKVATDEWDLIGALTA